jgi:hypothetical protein
VGSPSTATPLLSFLSEQQKLWRSRFFGSAEQAPGATSALSYPSELKQQTGLEGAIEVKCNPATRSATSFSCFSPDMLEQVSKVDFDMSVEDKWNPYRHVGQGLQESLCFP